MQDPVLVEVMRGGRVESCHAGAFAVTDTEGAVLLSGGDIDHPVYPRSAVKVIQALPLVESGAADRFGLDDEALALACASHGGEARHVAVAARMLAAAGQDAGRLECGAHWPSFREAWPAKAPNRDRCTTTARASMPASSAWPVAWGRTRAAM